MRSGRQQARKRPHHALSLAMIKTETKTHISLFVSFIFDSFRFDLFRFDFFVSFRSVSFLFRFSING